MPRYTISYHTSNTYVPFVKEAWLEFLVFPEISQHQKIIEKSIETDPFIKPYFGKNMFGFDIVRFTVREPLPEFKFTFRATVWKDPVNPFGFIQLPVEKEFLLMETDEFVIENYPYLNSGELTRLPDDFEYPVKKKNETAFSFIKRVNRFIHDLIVYDNSITNPGRILVQTISEKRGVCQDYAHLMLAILRKNRIPCRYVSGYLNQGGQMQGVGAVHAWVQAFVPGTGWLGFDPTNDLMEDHHYIKIAHGVDINDCGTLNGIVKGSVTNRTDYHVLVAEQNKEMNQ